MAKNYFDLVKDCCILLNLDEPAAFSALSDPEYQKITFGLNSINRHITLMEQERWTFRERSTTFSLIGGEIEYDKPDGDILLIKLPTQTTPLVPEYRYDWLPQNITGTPNRYSIYGDKILLYPTPSTAMAGTVATVRYVTHYTAKSAAGVDKENMELETDEPMMPNQYRDVLTYGACRDWKGMPDRSKYQHFNDRYNKTLKVMRANLKRSVQFEVYKDIGQRDGYGVGDIAGEYFEPWM